jgi:hypothetical protein
MSDSSYTWQTLSNPFPHTDTSEVMLGHATGRSTDILSIITGAQSAFILTGAPLIGKTALIRYLKGAPGDEWNWRQEEKLAALRSQMDLDQIYFVQINLTPLESSESVNKMLGLFVAECMQALSQIYRSDQQDQSALSREVKALRERLREISREHPQARFFVLLDAIERLDRPDVSFPELENSGAQTPQERAIALLNHCGAIRTLVDLIDEFSNFGVILSIRSLPRPNIADQFLHISADLARFTTTTLQCFTWKDTIAFLAQQPEDFGKDWAKAFRDLGGESIFTTGEQRWILEQAGTHPYLLQQFCFHTFYFKQMSANLHRCWSELQENDKKQIVELVNERISTFLTRLWKRLEEAVDKGSPETRNNFYEFISTLAQRRTDEEILPATWDGLGRELRYILSNEGVIRHDHFQPVYHPGATMRNYLAQKARENNLTTLRGFWLAIVRPGSQQERLSLSELEYRLIKTLLQHPKRCTEEALMKGAWGKPIERSTFTQRMHHLRKKLKDQCGDIEMITNHYGGLYSLNHPDWLHLE